MAEADVLDRPLGNRDQTLDPPIKPVDSGRPGKLETARSLLSRLSREKKSPVDLKELARKDPGISFFGPALDLPNDPDFIKAKDILQEQGVSGDVMCLIFNPNEVNRWWAGIRHPGMSGAHHSVDSGSQELMRFFPLWPDNKRPTEDRGPVLRSGRDGTYVMDPNDQSKNPFRVYVTLDEPAKVVHFGKSNPNTTILVNKAAVANQPSTSRT